MMGRPRISWIVLGCALLLAGEVPAEGAKPHPGRRPPLRVASKCQTPTHVTAMVGGKYRGQIARLYVPGDCGRYGSFRDYGRYPATSYAGHANLPAAYWVYHFPYWYLYQRQVRVGPLPRPVCQTPTNVTPSMGGKYLGRPLRLHLPGDCVSYGSYYDYGHYPATSYAGQSNIPAGYWVYHYPFWYVYPRRRP